jgi:hypothetical protein
MNQRWIKQTKGTYDFDVTKADKLFDFLVKEGRIKLPEGLLTVKIRQPSHEFTFGVGMSFIPYPLVLTPVV